MKAGCSVECIILTVSNTYIDAGGWRDERQQAKRRGTAYAYPAALF